MRLHLCTVPSEPLLVTLALFCVYFSRDSSDETAFVAGHLSSIFCVCEQGRFRRDCTCAQSHLNLSWSLMPRIVCMRAGKALARLHLRQIMLLFCVYEQERF